MSWRTASKLNWLRALTAGSEDEPPASRTPFGTGGHSASKLTWFRPLTGVSEAEPLASRTSFGIGGPADFLVEMSKPAAIEEGIAGCASRGVSYVVPAR